jgi:hypothetical protein
MSINITQQPKTKEYLECWRARPGHKLIQTDLSAIEPIVLTEYSKDPTLMSLYGPNAKPNDVYLFNAAHMSMWSNKVRTIYDPSNPTPETIAAAKKEFKTIRSISKTVHLAKQYGAGSFKIYQTLLENNVVDEESGQPLTREAVDRISEDWHALYAGIASFEQKLVAEWEFNRGWFYDGLYMPTLLHESRLKDIVNTFCQRTGHNILLFMLSYINDERKSRRIPMYPWIVDYHDETVWEVEESYAEAALQLLKDAYTYINDLLQPTIPIKGGFTVCDTLASIKCED